MACPCHKIVTLDRADLVASKSLLRTTSAAVVDRSDLSNVVAALRETLSRIEYGAGLAAVQIGIPVRVAIVNIGRTSQDELVLVNPMLIKATGRLTARQEGCLSLPGYKAEVVRRNKIDIQYEDLSGATVRLQATGYKAAVIQHELDHLDGVMFWDRLLPDHTLRAI